MPEMPEVEAVCRRLRERCLGARILRLRLLRRSMAQGDVEAASHEARLEGIERAGKNILFRLGDRPSLHIHLRMTGNLVPVPDHRFHDHTARAVWELEGGAGIAFTDPRALGRIALLQVEERLRIGIDPLDAAFTLSAFRELLAASRQPVKVFLLDQARIAGIGNIYAAEALFRSGIDPRREARSLREARAARLHEAIQETIRQAMDHAYARYAMPGQFDPEEDDSLFVYGREGLPCRECGATIRRIVQAARSTCFCIRCQR